MIFFTSDHHFGHTNVIKYCNRPFSSIDEMDDVLIDNWNSVVNVNDTVYHLGDFSFRDPKLYINRLKGRIFLIKGNHDRYRLKNSNLFIEFHDFGLDLQIEGQPITLCHYAMSVWNKSHFNSWHLFGHSHGKHKEVGKTYDVGVDCNDFTPVSFSKIQQIMSTKPDNLNFIRK